MLGYFGNQAATEQSFNKDGWFLSGDLGVLDERGNLRDRRPPQGHRDPRRPQHPPGQGRGACGEAPEDRAKRPPSACRTSGSARGCASRSAAARRRGARRRTSCCSTCSRPGLSKFDMPEYFVVLDAFPLTASGKVLKRELAAWAREGRIAPEPCRFEAPQRRPGDERLLDRLDLPPGLARRRRRCWSGRSAQLAAEVIAPRAAHHDRTAEFPWDNVKAINALGLNAMFVPEAYGGAPVSYCRLSRLRARDQQGLRGDRQRLVDQLPRHEAADRLRHRGAEAAPACRGSPRAGSARLCITEPHAGSDATGMRTRFTPEGDQIRIDGGKTFITNGDVADRYLLFGKWSGIEDPRQRDLGRGGRGRHAGPVGRAHRGQDGHPRVARPRRSPSRTAACRAPTCWASRATG